MVKELLVHLEKALKNTFPDMDLEVQKEMTPQTQLEELNDYLIMLAKMDTIGVRRKLFLLEGYMNKVIPHLVPVNMDGSFVFDGKVWK